MSSWENNCTLLYLEEPKKKKIVEKKEKFSVCFSLKFWFVLFPCETFANFDVTTCNRCRITFFKTTPYIKGFFCLLVLSQRTSIRNGFGRRNVPLVRHSSRPRARNVLPRQYYLRDHIGGIQQIRPVTPGRI